VTEKPLDSHERTILESIPLDRYGTQLPQTIESSWVFVLRANVATGAERHPNSHPLDERWISIPVGVWHQGVVGPDNWAVVSFHTVPEHELIEERPAVAAGEPARQRKYADDICGRMPL